MQLSRDEFLTRYNQGNLKIAFIGMSNIGKSYLSTRLAKAYGFERTEIDQHIQAKLAYKSMTALATWQGHPYEEGYQQREATYLALEGAATEAALSNVSGLSMLDTAGSVIYLDEKILNRLKTIFYIVYIKASQADLKRLEEMYFQHPKPLIWNNHFTSNPQKSSEDNIRTSYPELIAARQRHYEALADTTLPSNMIYDGHIQDADMWQALHPPQA